MSYSLTFTETPAEAVERVRREQLDAAAESLERGEDPVEAIHDARKRIKKTRALLRLARPGLSDKHYRRSNSALRDAGREMSGARDADVLVETVDDLAERYAGQKPKTFFTRLRKGLATETEADAGAHADTLRALAGEPWPVKDFDPDDLAASLRRTYARGRKAFAKADHDPSTENLHEWRKRVKDLWYQQRLLEETWPGVMKAQAKEAKRLSKLLGSDHDLAVLSQHADDADLDELIDARRAELLTEARALGRRVYAERPKAFSRRAARYVDLAAA